MLEIKNFRFWPLISTIIEQNSYFENIRTQMSVKVSDQIYAFQSLIFFAF